MSAHVIERPELDFDIWTNPGLLSEPHEAMRGMAGTMPPIFWTAANGGHWVVTDAALMEEVSTDYSRFSARGNRIPFVEGGIPMIPLNYDPPDHTYYRKILVRWFGPNSVSKLKSRIEYWAENLVASVADKGGCDFMDAIGGLFPVSIFMEMMGLPLERLREYRAIVVEYFSTTDSVRWLELQDEISRQMREVIQARMIEPRDDLISFFIKDRTDGRALTQAELEAMCNLLFQAGMDTVANFAGFLFKFLAARPDLQAQIAGDKSLIPAAVEEGLRMFGVVNNGRLVVDDIDFAGVRLHGGDAMLCMLPFAGMDARYNSKPNEFDLQRAQREYMIFSRGVHLCAGHNLARTEMQMLLAAWFEKIPSFRLAKNNKPSFRAGQVLAIDNLMLEWD